MRSRLPLWTGLLASLFLLQLSWWGYLIWSDAKELRDSRYQSLVRQLESIRSSLAGEDDLEAAREAWQMRASDYPEFTWVEDSGVQISAQALGELEREWDGDRAMVLSEASLFAILAGLGIGLLVRTWRREQFLRLQQSNFLHAVTHELRSPLQALRLTGETLQRRPSAERAERYSTVLLADVERLETLVNNLLAVGRLDAEAFRAQGERIDLGAAISNELRSLQARRSDAEGVEFTVHGELWAWADPTTLEAVLRNLVDNAIKYGEGSPIHVELGQDGNEALLSVEDGGRGLDSRERQQVFERFWRAGDERVRTAPGTGLGLFLVKKLLEAQDARIEVHSAGHGHGCRFEVRWPLA